MGGGGVASALPIMDKKIRVLALCDSPTSATGFAQVSRNILTGLAKTGNYLIDVIGINYYGDFYDRSSHPYNIYPAMPQGYADMYGRGRLLNAINGGEEKFGLKQGWDIIFTIQDPFIIEGLGVDYPFGEQLRCAREMWKRTIDPKYWYQWIGYFPVDSEVKENWVTRSIALPDYPVAYCEWGASRILQYDRDVFKVPFNLKITEDGVTKKAHLKVSSLKERLKIIHHGVDLSVFKPLPQDEILKFRKEYFTVGVKDNTYLVVNVSRNQPRKDLTRTIAAFAKFKKLVPSSHLYLHCKVNDAGGSIHEMARNFGLSRGDDYSVPTDFSAGVGYPVEVVNKIYNAADLCVTTTLGEGWGLITTEAMATKTPIIAPNITSIIDIFGSQSYSGAISELETNNSLRGIPVKAGFTSSEWVCLGMEDNERIRPLTNVDDMVDKMVWAYSHPQEIKKMVERGYSWVQALDWKIIVEKWDRLFQKAYAELISEREFGNRIDKAGRNDLCPCGSHLKFKKCHGGPLKTDKFRDWLEA